MAFHVLSKDEKKYVRRRKYKESKKYAETFSSSLNDVKVNLNLKYLMSAWGVRTKFPVNSSCL